MDNIAFVDEENIPMVHNKHYENYKIPIQAG